MSDFHKLAVEMEEGSWYTILGAGGDLHEWMNGYQQMLDAENIGKISRWEVFSGHDMNVEYGLSGDKGYQDGLTFLAFPLDGLDVSKLALFRIRMGDHWFDDLVANNRNDNDEED